MNAVEKLILWFAGFLILWSSLIAFADRGHTHDAGGWKYPMMCCHDADCAPADWQGENSAGEAVANTKHHSGVPTDPKRYTHKFTSPDQKLHICASPDSALGMNPQRTYYCIFQPAGM